MSISLVWYTVTVYGNIEDIFTPAGFKVSSIKEQTIIKYRANAYDFWEMLHRLLDLLICMRETNEDVKVEFEMKIRFLNQANFELPPEALKKLHRIKATVRLKGYEKP